MASKVLAQQLKRLGKNQLCSCQMIQLTFPQSDHSAVFPFGTALLCHVKAFVTPMLAQRVNSEWKHPPQQVQP